MNCSSVALIWLEIISATGASPSTWARLLRHMTSQEMLNALSSSEGRESLSRLIGRSVGQPQKSSVSEQLRRLEKNSCGVVCIEDGFYPALLREIDDPPCVLFYAGDISCLSKETVCVVGTRRPTRRGTFAARRISADLSAMGIHIVSGLARGIDAAAHEGALEHDGGTSAVLGCGVDVIYPPEHAELASRIRERGCLVSEYPLGTSPLRHHFPLRNRILSGLSRAVVVIEAAEKSGALGTASWALHQNRDVFAVPGPIDSPMSVGPHELIRSGAGLVTCAEHIVQAVPMLTKKALSGSASVFSCERSFDGPEMSVLGALDLEPKHIDEIVRICNSSSSNLLPVLLDLEMKGEIVSFGNGTYALAKPIFSRTKTDRR